MTPSGQTICLCMIVKNEAHVIQRCLASVWPIIDHWIIVDTGSTDGTQDIIRTVMANLSGEVIERPWRDFASNRSESLALARPHGDYSLIIDADDELVLDADFRMPDLDADSYSVDIVYGASHYRRPQLVRNALPWRYRGVLHEFLECADATTSGHLPITMRINHEGRRSTDPETYRRDAAILEQALATETDPFLIARYTFYLAQSYRDSGRADAALTAYLHRATLGFWIEEVYFSYFQAGRMMEALGRDPDEIIATYAYATRSYPVRVEADHAASRLCRLNLRYQQGYEIAKAAIDRPFPDGALFVEPWVYHYGLLDEYSVNAYWSGHYRESLDGALRAMASPHLPAADLPRFVANARFASDKLPAMHEEEICAERLLLDVSKAAGALPDPVPRVLIAILAKQKQAVLPLYLQCIEALDYPKSSIVLYIRTNNNTDRTGDILRDWSQRVTSDYAHVEFDDTNVSQAIEHFGVHEWNATRFRVLAEIRNDSLEKTTAYKCDFYFVADLDNFLAPFTLRHLVSLDLPIVAPMLRHVDPTSPYSNYHAGIDSNGYFADVPDYNKLLLRTAPGVYDVPVVHCTYLIRTDQLSLLRYDDASERHEYVVFSESARRHGIPQYLDNRREYGLLTLDDDKHDLIGSQLHTIAERLGLSNREREETAELQRAFENIYRKDAWSHGSGPGPYPSNTIECRGFLERFMEANKVTSVTDLGCGDWQSSWQIDWSAIAYTGLDVVASVITENQARHGSANKSFKLFRFTADLPGGDLLIAKEVLQHLPNATIGIYVEAIRRKYRFALFINSAEPDNLVNLDIEPGGYRPLRLQDAPFSVPGATVFTYFPQAGNHIWKNVVFLVMGFDELR